MRVEGVSYNVNWSKFRQGYSVFVPCIQPSKAKEEILATTKRLKIAVVFKVVVNEGIQGLRVWRV